MNENCRQILEMLSENKITADEAERLIAALEQGEPAAPTPAHSEPSAKPRPKYLRVLVDSTSGSRGGPTKVNIRVPLQLLRAGVKLANLIPVQARVHVNSAMREHGMQIDLSQLKPENLEEIVEQFNDFTMDVDDKDVKVRLFCE
ncbi:MAG: SHOCT-like domain-containing protein [Candidatus Acidiferrales bacterium]